MTVSLATLVSRVRDRISGDEPWEDTIDASLTNVATTVTINSYTDWVQGSVMEFADGEQCLVIATPSTSAVAIRRAHNGTTAIAHSNGDLILRDPRFAYADVVDAIDDTIADLWPFVYDVTTYTVTPVAGTTLYDPNKSDLRGVVALSQPDAVSATTIFYYGSGYNALPVRFLRNVQTTTFAYGMGLEFQQFYTTATNITVTYARDFTDTTIPEGLGARTVVAGTVQKMMERFDVPRTGQDNSQGDVTVPAGTTIKDAAWWQRNFEQLRRQWNLLVIRENPLASEWKA